MFEVTENGVVTGELIAELVLSREDAKQYEILRPYLPGGIKSDMPHVRFYWDFFSEGKPAYVSVRYLALAAHYLGITIRNRLLVTCGSDFHGKHKPKIRLGGHGASWTDDQLITGIKYKMRLS